MIRASLAQNTLTSLVSNKESSRPHSKNENFLWMLVDKYIFSSHLIPAINWNNDKRECEVRVVQVHQSGFFCYPQILLLQKLKIHTAFTTAHHEVTKMFIPCLFQKHTFLKSILNANNSPKVPIGISIYSFLYPHASCMFHPYQCTYLENPSSSRWSVCIFILLIILAASNSIT